MRTMMDVTILVHGVVDVTELSKDLEGFDVAVGIIGTETARVHTKIDVVNDAIEHILAVCRKYGDHEVRAHRIF